MENKMTWKKIISQQILKGQPIEYGKTPNKTQPKGRICEQEGCTTPLSIYNPNKTCRPHTPMVPVVDVR